RPSPRTGKISLLGWNDLLVVAKRALRCPDGMLARAAWFSRVLVHCQLLAEGPLLGAELVQEPDDRLREVADGLPNAADVLTPEQIDPRDAPDGLHRPAEDVQHASEQLQPLPLQMRARPDGVQAPAVDLQWLADGLRQVDH